MSQLTQFGTAIARSGTLQYGAWEAFQHPTGHVEFLPVIIAQGKAEGPCLWLTAGIHGNEHAGPVVIYKLLTQELVDQLRGTVIAIPALNPAGLRTMKREPYHDDTDPNRLWPDGKPKPSANPYKEPASALEAAYEKLFNELIPHVDYMIDYHNASIGSLSFSFRDRVLYRQDQNADQNKAEAEALSQKQAEMLAAYGHTTITEMPFDSLVDEDLHRSTSAAVLYLGRKPAITVELGAGQMPDPAIVSAAVCGTRNILRWAGMLPGEMEPIQGIKVVDPGFRVRRCPTPRVTQTCIVLHRVEAGDWVKAGDPVAEIRDVWGRPLGDGNLKSEYDGFVIGRHHGIYYYPGNAILSMAIRDEAPLVVPYPETYFQTKR